MKFVRTSETSSQWHNLNSREDQTLCGIDVTVESVLSDTVFGTGGSNSPVDRCLYCLNGMMHPSVKAKVAIPLNPGNCAEEE